MDPLLALLDSITPAAILPRRILNQPHLTFQLSSLSDFAGIDPRNTAAMIAKTDSLMAQHQAAWAIGRYGEQRELYTHPQYTQPQRSVHLGLDLSAPAGTDVFAPLIGKCHSFQDNAQPGDYGPTIILEHRINELTFYSLYGHLNREALTHLHPGKIINVGERLGHIGTPDENGGWPPHCHVQLIRDIGEYRGDFPGVCSHIEATEWLHRCPDPNRLLKLY